MLAVLQLFNTQWAVEGEKNFQSFQSTNSTIFIGFVTSLIICLIVGPDVVQTESAKSLQNVIPPAREYAEGFMLIITIFMAVRFIRRREAFHRAQTSFLAYALLPLCPNAETSRKIVASGTGR